MSLDLHQTHIKIPVGRLPMFLILFLLSWPHDVQLLHRRHGSALLIVSAWESTEQMMLHKWGTIRNRPTHIDRVTCILIVHKDGWQSKPIFMMIPNTWTLKCSKRKFVHPLHSPVSSSASSTVWSFCALINTWFALLRMKMHHLLKLS